MKILYCVHGITRQNVNEYDKLRPKYYERSETPRVSDRISCRISSSSLSVGSWPSCSQVTVYLSSFLKTSLYECILIQQPETSAASSDTSVVGHQNDVCPAVSVDDRFPRERAAEERPGNAYRRVVDRRIIQNVGATAVRKVRAINVGHDESDSYAHCTSPNPRAYPVFFIGWPRPKSRRPRAGVLGRGSNRLPSSYSCTWWSDSHIGNL